MTRAVEKSLPALYAQEKLGEKAIAHVKFFAPWSNWTWYATEYDPKTRMFFGLVSGFEDELGSFSLDELQSVKGPYGLRIERDMYWTPKTVGEIMTMRRN